MVKLRWGGFVLLSALLCPAWAGGDRIINENQYVEDSDDAIQHAYYLGYVFEPALTGNGDQLGVSVGRLLFDDPSGSEDFGVLRLKYDTALPADSHLNLRASKLFGSSWSPLLGGITLGHDAGPWHLEIYADREMIDSVPGIQQELLSDSFGASADYRLSEQWTVVGAGFHQMIDDGNDRNGGSLRLVFQPSRLPGLSLQTRSRYIKSDFDGIGYFSPPVLEEHLLLLGYARSTRNDKWVFSALAGPGLQRIKDGSGDVTRNDLFYVELKARGWFTEHVGLEARAACSNTGGPNNGLPDSDYRYCSATLSFIGAF